MWAMGLGLRFMTEVIHEPRLDTLAMIEKSILDSEEYPTKMELWRSLPKQVQYQTFQRALAYLEASEKIAFDRGVIIYTGVASQKLKDFLNSSKRIR
jgi:hypothetical protein